MSDDAPFGILLIDSARLMRAHFDRALNTADLGLTPGEARALTYARRYDGARQTVLAARMLVEPMTLVGFLDRLERCGLVERLPDPSDRRAKIVRVTEKGQPLADRVDAAFIAVRDAMLADFSAEEIVMFKAMLARLRNRLQADECQAVQAVEA